ncbi:MAG: SLC13 family permease [Elainellaceae cyanobacterium]
MSILLTLTILLGAFICCLGEWIPLDIVAILVTVMLMILGLVTPEEGISGFANPATITVMAMFILSAGIAQTGAIQQLRDLLLRWGGRHPKRQIFALGMIAGPVTAFINNTAVVAVFLPIVEEWCDRLGISVSKLLIPLSYATILGGMITVIGTSTTVLASGLSEQLGYGRFGLFEFTKLGVTTFGIGLAYLAFIAPSLLPNRQPHADSITDVKFDARQTQKAVGQPISIAEVLVPSNSTLIGSTLRDLHFRQRYSATVLAIRRGEALTRDRLGEMALQFGDVLLVQGPQQNLLGFQTSRNLLVLQHQELDITRHERAWIAIAIGLGVVGLTAFNVLPILVSALLGAVLMVLTGCLKPGELYSAVRWNIIFLLAGLIPLGIAMEKSGATQLLAQGLMTLCHGLSGYWLLTFFFVATALITEVLSNNASVVLLLPIAAEVAEGLNFNPFAFMLVVTFAASNSFMTPIGYQTNTMVYGPGGYRFLDFFRVGMPLSALMAIVTPALIMLFYGL